MSSRRCRWVVERRTEAAHHTAADHHIAAVEVEKHHNAILSHTVGVEVGKPVAAVVAVHQRRPGLDCGLEQVHRSLFLGTTKSHQTCCGHQADHLLMPQTGTDHPGFPHIHFRAAKRHLSHK